MDREVRQRCRKEERGNMLMRVYVIWQKFRDGVVCQCFPIPPNEVALLRSLKVFF